MTTTEKKIPVAGQGNEDNEQILNTDSAVDCIAALLEEADRILIDDAQDLLDRLIF